MVYVGGMSSVPFPQIYAEVAAGRPRKAMDLVFQTFDTAFQAGQFEAANEALKAVDLTRLDPVVALAFLTISHAAAAHLPALPELVARIDPWLKEKIGAARAAHLMRGFPTRPRGGPMDFEWKDGPTRQTSSAERAGLCLHVRLLRGFRRRKPGERVRWEWSVRWTVNEAAAAAEGLPASTYTALSMEGRIEGSMEDAKRAAERRYAPLEELRAAMRARPRPASTPREGAS